MVGAYAILNRPLVAALFYNHLSYSLINSLSRSSILSESLRHCLSQTVRARDHVSHVMFHMSHITCQVSHVRCKESQFFIQSGGASRWRVCYHWCLPCLVLKLSNQFKREFLNNNIFYWLIL